MIANLKDLQALLKLCRKQGVSSIKVGGTEITFGDMPKKQADATPDEGDVPDDPNSDGLTPEELMFYSAGLPHENQEGQ